MSRALPPPALLTLLPLLLLVVLLCSPFATPLNSNSNSDSISGAFPAPAVAVTELLADSWGDSGPWVELYNYGGEAVSLGAAWVLNSHNQDTALPAYVLQPGAFVVLTPDKQSMEQEWFGGQTQQAVLQMSWSTQKPQGAVTLKYNNNPVWSMAFQRSSDGNTRGIALFLADPDLSQPLTTSSDIGSNGYQNTNGGNDSFKMTSTEDDVGSPLQGSYNFPVAPVPEPCICTISCNGTMDTETNQCNCTLCPEPEPEPEPCVCTASCNGTLDTETNQCNCTLCPEPEPEPEPEPCVCTASCNGTLDTETNQCNCTLCPEPEPEPEPCVCTASCNGTMDTETNQCNCTLCPEPQPEPEPEPEPCVCTSSCNGTMDTETNQCNCTSCGCVLSSTLNDVMVTSQQVVTAASMDPGTVVAVLTVSAVPPEMTSWTLNLVSGASLFKLDGLNVVAKVSISAGTYTPLIAFSDPCGTSVQRTLQLTFVPVVPVATISLPSVQQVRELAPAGTLVGQVTLQPSSEPFTLLFAPSGTGSDDNDLFALEGRNVVVKTPPSEARIHRIRLRATNSVQEWTEATFDIPVLSARPLVPTQVVVSNVEHSASSPSLTSFQVDFQSQGVPFSDVPVREFAVRISPTSSALSKHAFVLFLPSVGGTTASTPHPVTLQVSGQVLLPAMDLQVSVAARNSLGLSSFSTPSSTLVQTPMGPPSAPSRPSVQSSTSPGQPISSNVTFTWEAPGSLGGRPVINTVIQMLFGVNSTTMAPSHDLLRLQGLHTSKELDILQDIAPRAQDVLNQVTGRSLQQQRSTLYTLQFSMQVAAESDLGVGIFSSPTDPIAVVVPKVTVPAEEEGTSASSASNSSQLVIIAVTASVGALVATLVTILMVRWSVKRRQRRRQLGSLGKSNKVGSVWLDTDDMPGPKVDAWGFQAPRNGAMLDLDALKKQLPLSARKSSSFSVANSMTPDSMTSPRWQSGQDFVPHFLCSRQDSQEDILTTVHDPEKGFGAQDFSHAREEDDDDVCEEQQHRQQLLEDGDDDDDDEFLVVKRAHAVQRSDERQSANMLTDTHVPSHRVSWMNGAPGQGLRDALWPSNGGVTARRRLTSAHTRAPKSAYGAVVRPKAVRAAPRGHDAAVGSRGGRPSALTQPPPRTLDLIFGAGSSSSTASAKGVPSLWQSGKEPLDMQAMEKFMNQELYTESCASTQATGLTFVEEGSTTSTSCGGDDHGTPAVVAPPAASFLENRSSSLLLGLSQQDRGPPPPPPPPPPPSLPAGAAPPPLPPSLPTSPPSPSQLKLRALSLLKQVHGRLVSASSNTSHGSSSAVGVVLEDGSSPQPSTSLLWESTVSRSNPLYQSFRRRHSSRKVILEHLLCRVSSMGSSSSAGPKPLVLGSEVSCATLSSESSFSSRSGDSPSMSLCSSPSSSPRGVGSSSSPPSKSQLLAPRDSQRTPPSLMKLVNLAHYGVMPQREDRPHNIGDHRRPAAGPVGASERRSPGSKVASLVPVPPLPVYHPSGGPHEVDAVHPLVMLAELRVRSAPSLLVSIPGRTLRRQGETREPDHVSVSKSEVLPRRLHLVVDTNPPQHGAGSSVIDSSTSSGSQCSSRSSFCLSSCPSVDEGAGSVESPSHDR